MKEPQTFHNRLLEFQTKVEAVKKEKENPFFKSKYADINVFLSVVKPLLSECGLFLTQPLKTQPDGTVELYTSITDGVDKLDSSIPVPQYTDIQKFGAAITYLRRYSLQSLLALEAEDDDGEGAKGGKLGLTATHKKEIAQIKTVKELGSYYKKHEHVGQELIDALGERKAEILSQVEVTEEDVNKALK